MLQAYMFVNLERPFHLPIYAQQMVHALISSKPTQVPIPRFCGDPWVLKYLDVYASQDDLLVEHGLVDGDGNLARPFSLSYHLLALILDLLSSPVVRQTLNNYLHFITIFHDAWLLQ